MSRIKDVHLILKKKFHTGQVLRSCGKCIFAYNFRDRTIFFYLFHLQTLGAEHHIPSFFNFWIIKFRKLKKLKLENVMYFRLCSVFLLERDQKCKNYECDSLCNPIPYKIMFVIVSATLDSLVKNCWRRCIFSAKVQFFRGREKHLPPGNITILTMCKISTKPRIKLPICNVCIITLMK